MTPALTHPVKWVLPVPHSLSISANSIIKTSLFCTQSKHFPLENEFRVCVANSYIEVLVDFTLPLCTVSEMAVSSWTWYLFYVWCNHSVDITFHQGKGHKLHVPQLDALWKRELYTLFPSRQLTLSQRPGLCGIIMVVFLGFSELYFSLDLLQCSIEWVHLPRHAAAPPSLSKS